MKKVIWIFGESATGKLTLINNLLANEKLRNLFNINSNKISVVKNTLGNGLEEKTFIEDKNIYDDTDIEEDNKYFRKDRMINRRSSIMNDTVSFINSNNDILLIKGQSNDLYQTRGNIVNYFLDKFYDKVDIEVYILRVNDINELKRRVETKEWFKNFDDKEEILNKIISSQNEHCDEVLNSFKDYDISLKIVESLNNNYKVGENINGKSSGIRRKC